MVTRRSTRAARSPTFLVVFFVVSITCIFYVKELHSQFTRMSFTMSEEFSTTMERNELYMTKNITKDIDLDDLKNETDIAISTVITDADDNVDNSTNKIESNATESNDVEDEPIEDEENMEKSVTQRTIHEDVSTDYGTEESYLVGNNHNRTNEVDRDEDVTLEERNSGVEESNESPTSAHQRYTSNRTDSTNGNDDDADDDDTIWTEGEKNYHDDGSEDNDVDNGEKIMSEYEQQVKLKHPSTICIGTQKGGTSALGSYLKKHPDIVSSHLFEPHQFDVHFNPGAFDLETIDAKNKYLQNYQKRVFSDNLQTLESNPQMESFEKTPIYIFHPDVAERVKTIVPWVKFILLLRDPIDRAFSHFRMTFERGNLSKSTTFDECVQIDVDALIGYGIIPEDYKTSANRKIDLRTLKDNWRKYFKNRLGGKKKKACDALVGRGLYSMQLLFWKEAFGEDALLGKKQFLALKSDSISPNENGEIDLRRITDFMNITDISPLKAKKIHSTRDVYKGKVSEELKSDLQVLYQPFDRELSTLLGSEWLLPWSYSTNHTKER